VGKKSAVETALKIFEAFEERKTWRQAALAKVVDVTVESLRKYLELITIRQIVRQQEGADVYWTMYGSPEGFHLPPKDVDKLVRLLRRAPASDLRDEAVMLLLTKGPKQQKHEAVKSAALSKGEERALEAIEDCASASAVLRMKYNSGARGETTRDVSVHCVQPGPPVRFLAYCHFRNELRWFRAANIVTCQRNDDVQFVRVPESVVDAKLQEGVHTYADGSEEPGTFVVSREARWVKNNLPDGMTYVDMESGIRVTYPKGGLSHAARFVVGLGALATAETEVLKVAVRALAEAALRSLGVAASEPPASERRKRTPEKKARRA
jgi:predicted DNA-binding transcriptional regulator YafY